MKNKCLLLLILLLGSSAFGQKQSFDKLTLNLTALKLQVLPLEPIPFGLTLENQTDAPIKVETSLSFKVSYISLEIKKPDGLIVTPSQLSSVRARTLVLPRELSPGGNMDATQIFDFQTRDYFGKVGSYQVRATLNNKDGQRVRSEWVEVSVVAPTGMDKDAYDYLLKKSKKRSDNSMLFGGWGKDDLEEFVLLHPGTTYANYARFGLGQLYEMSRENDKAEAQFRQIQDTSFFYAREVGEKLKKLEQEKNKDQ